MNPQPHFVTQFFGAIRAETAARAAALPASNTDRIAEIDARMKLLEFRMKLAAAERRLADREALLERLAELEIERESLAAQYWGIE